MSFYQTNVRILAERQPAIISKLNLIEKQSLELIPTKSGSFTLQVNHDGQLISLHSSYNPERESQRLVQNFKIQGSENIVLFGVGLGYHLLELVSYVKNSDFVIVVEKNIEVFQKFLEVVDLQSLTSIPIYFIIDEAPSNIGSYLNQFGASILANGLMIVEHPVSVQINRNYFDQMMIKIKDFIQYNEINYHSQKRTRFKYLSTTMKNFVPFNQSPGINLLENIFKNETAVLVAAGPSLNKNIFWLSQFKNKALIIAVDTALKLLLQNDIIPDIVVSVDYTENTARYFNSLANHEFALIVDPEVYPEVLTQFKGVKFVMNLSNKSVSQWMEQEIDSKGSLDKGVSVAHTGFHLAEYLGIERLILVGVDLAFSGGLSHAKGTAMSRPEKYAKDTIQDIYVKDIFDRDVKTSASLKVFLTHFEKLLMATKMKCIDATEGGAYIEGTLVMHLREAYIKYIDFMKKREFLKEIKTISYHRDICKEKNIPFVLKKLAIELKEVSQVNNDCQIMLAKMTKLISNKNGNIEQDSNLVKQFLRYTKLFKQLFSYHHILNILSEFMTSLAVMIQLKDDTSIDQIKEIKSIKKLLDKHEIYFDDIKLATDEFLKYLEILRTENQWK